MSYRLLIDIEVLDFARTHSRREQQILWKRFREIGKTPRSFTDYTEHDAT
jgi:hypothetical protein